MYRFIGWYEQKHGQEKNKSNICHKKAKTHLTAHMVFSLVCESLLTHRSQRKGVSIA